MTNDERRVTNDGRGKASDQSDASQPIPPSAFRLPPSEQPSVRVAAVGDVHFSLTAPGALKVMLSAVNDVADVLVLCGDLTDYGLPEEARGLGKELSANVRIPMIGVLGNHDFESGQPDEVRKILQEAGVTMLDGEGCEVRGIGFAGTKGFGGGFGPRTLGYWGEPVIKQFVQEAIDETLKLEKALLRLQSRTQIVVLHYSPIQATVVGEAVDIYPFMGTSRLEETINRFPVTTVLHGHSHNGSIEGRTSAGVPVYNVALPLLRRSNVGWPPVRIVEVPDGSGQSG